MKWMSLGLLAFGLAGGSLAVWMVSTAPQVSNYHSSQPDLPAPAVEVSKKDAAPVASITWSQIQSRAGKSQNPEPREKQTELSVDTAPIWKDLNGVCVDMALGGLVVQSKTQVGVWPIAPTLDAETGREIVNVGQFHTAPIPKYSYSFFVVLNFQKSVARGDPVVCKAAMVGTKIYKGKPIAVWDCHP